jgi:ubiquitin carboxyl-terminal hydrolase 4/11/15
MQRCEKASEEEEEKEKNVKQSEDSKKGIVGLQNLGNTCFMNGGLQCMLNMKELTQYFLSDKFANEINEQNPLGTKGKLVQKYATLVKNVWFGNSSVYSPWALKEALSKFAPMVFNNFLF